MKRNKKRFFRFAFRGVVALTVIITCLSLGIVEISAYESETMPDEYLDFIEGIEGSVADKLPDGIFSNDADEVNNAAQALTDPINILSVLIEAVGEGISDVAPTLATVLGTVFVAALINSFSSSLGGISRAVETCVRLCTFCVLSASATARVEVFREYLDNLLAAVSSFLPLCATAYAMGGNLTSAAGSVASLGAILTVCELFCTRAAIPIFSVCLCLSLLSAFDGWEIGAGGAISSLIRKWYLRALSFVMMLLTSSLGAQTLLSSRADGMAMRSFKFVASSFVPVSGGTVSSTLGTLASSVELLRGSIGVVGIVIIILMLLPVIVELALLRLVFSVGCFCSSSLGCSREARLLGELDSLYGYLEGIAILSAVIFLVVFGIFASVATPFS